MGVIGSLRIYGIVRYVLGGGEGCFGGSCGENKSCFVNFFFLIEGRR